MKRRKVVMCSHYESCRGFDVVCNHNRTHAEMDSCATSRCRVIDEEVTCCEVINF